MPKNILLVIKMGISIDINFNQLLLFDHVIHPVIHS